MNRQSSKHSNFYHRYRRTVVFAAAIMILHIVSLLYLKFTAWPEMLLWPHLINNGWTPYSDIAIAHTPILLYLLAVVYKIAGLSIFTLKIFTWSLILLTDVLLFLIALRLFGKKAALWGLVMFVVWQTVYDGNGLWFDSLIALLAVVIYYLSKSNKYFFAGLVWGFAFLVKQTAFWFVIPILYLILKHIPKSRERFIKLTLGVLTVGVLAVLYFIWNGFFIDFYNWAIKFGIFTLPRSTGQISPPNIKSILILLLPFSVFFLKGTQTIRKEFDLVLWAISGSLTAFPRFEYFHLQPAIPFLAFAFGKLISARRSGSFIVKYSIYFFILITIYLFSSYFFRNFKEGTRFYEKEVAAVADYVKANSDPGDSIFVLNWWDSVYAFTNTLPATRPWVPQLSWYQDDDIQAGELMDLINNPPEIVVMQPYSQFGLASYTPAKLYNFVLENYRFVNKIDGIDILIKK